MSVYLWILAEYLESKHGNLLSRHNVSTDIHACKTAIALVRVLVARQSESFDRGQSGAEKAPLTASPLALSLSLSVLRETVKRALS